GTAGQVADVADGGFHDVIVAQVRLDLARLGRRLDDDESLGALVFCHLVLPCNFRGLGGSIGAVSAFPPESNGTPYTCARIGRVCRGAAINPRGARIAHDNGPPESAFP